MIAKPTYYFDERTKTLHFSMCLADRSAMNQAGIGRDLSEEAERGRALIVEMNRQFDQCSRAFGGPCQIKIHAQMYDGVQV